MDPGRKLPVRNALRSSPSGVPQIGVIAGKLLRRRLKTDPEQAIDACGADLKCIAKLGQKSKASEVIYARVVGGSDGVARSDPPKLQRAGLAAFAKSIPLLGGAIKEAPEFATIQRRREHARLPDRHALLLQPRGKLLLVR